MVGFNPIWKLLAQARAQMTADQCDKNDNESKI